MSNQGWIKLHRTILDCDLWLSDEPFSMGQAWIDLLLRANHQDKDMVFDLKTLTVTRGQLITSVRKLAERWKWSTKRTLKFLRLLEEMKMIERESDNKKTLLTIVNYAIYQDCGNANETQTKRNGNATETQNAHKQEIDISVKEDISIKNEKNDKNEKNNIRSVFYPNDDSLNEAFAEYVQMRKKLRKPFATDHAIELAMKKLEKLSGGDNDLAIEILNQSIENSWQGLFEVKKSKGSGNSYIDNINNRVNQVDDWV